MRQGIRIPYILFLMTTTLILAQAVPAAAAPRGWQVLSTPHFILYARPEHEEIMRSLAVIAEEVHPLVTTYVGHTPTTPTHVVIMDIGDLPNGMASSYFFHKIIVFPVHFGNSVAYQTGMGPRLDDPLRMLFIHEYTHIVQGDMPGTGFAGFVRRWFGHVPLFATPNFLQPPLSVEGLAVRAETMLTTAGRGRDPFYDMFLRTAVLEGKLFRLDEALSHYAHRWNPASGPYLYGEALMQYIEEHYGAPAIQEMNRKFPAGPPLLGEAVRKTLGITLNELWNGWEEETRAKFTEQAAEISASGVTPLAPLSGLGDISLHPVYSPDGRYLAYISAGGVLPGIYLFDVERKRTQLAVAGYAQFGGNLAWSPDSRTLVYSRANDDSPTRQFTDIYLYDIASRRERRLTSGLRAYAPCFTPDGQQVLFISRPDPLSSALFTVAVAGGKPEELALPFPVNLLHLSAEYSPDGLKLAVAGWLLGGYTDIYLADLSQGIVTRLTADTAVDENPAWSPAGRYILYDSDVSGVYNLYAYDTVENKRYQVTNVLTGVFAPAVAPGGEHLAAMEYTADGYRISTLPLDPALWRPAADLPAGGEDVPAISGQAAPIAPAAVDKPLAAAGAALRRYSPWPSLAPKYWLPMIAPDEKGLQLGIITSGADVLERTSYSLQTGYGLGRGRFSYDIAIAQAFGRNEQWQWTLRAAETPVQDNAVWQRQAKQELGLAYAWGNMLQVRQLRAFATATRAVGTSSGPSLRYTGQLYSQDLAGTGVQQHGTTTLLSLGHTAGQHDTALSYLRQDRLYTRRDALTLRLGLGVARNSGCLSVGGRTPGFGVRGTGTSAAGRVATAASVQYERRYPVGRGHGDWPVFIEELTMGPFMDTSWTIAPAGGMARKISVGWEFGIATVAAYAVPLDLRVGLALPLWGSGRPGLYAGGQVQF